MHLTKLKNLLIIDTHIVNSVSAQKIDVPKLDLTRLETVSARLGSAWEISARTHHYLTGKYLYKSQK